MRAAQIVGDFTRHAAVADGGGDVVRAWFGPAGKFSQYDAPVADVLDDARRDAVEADEAKPAENLCGRKERGELLFVAESVLQRDDRSVRIDERRQQFRELIVRRGL